jgi:hypothetical protein
MPLRHLPQGGHGRSPRQTETRGVTEPPVQLSILTAAGDTPPRWTCPTCRGNRQMIRLLYPDEITPDGPLTEVCACRTCNAQGWLDWDPDDHSYFPH